jgi:hypothetical protein
MLERQQIENRDALAVAAMLSMAFERFCGTPAPAGASGDANA